MGNDVTLHEQQIARNKSKKLLLLGPMISSDPIDPPSERVVSRPADQKHVLQLEPELVLLLESAE